MVGFILAAGFGTRLKPITDTVPKALVPICGEPLLAHNLRRLRRTGIFSAIGVNSHHLHEKMELYRQASLIPFELFHERDKIRGTGGALDFAREFLSRDNAFLVANVDILHRFDLAEMHARFMSEGRICSLVAIPAEGQGTVLYDGGNGDVLGVSSDRDALVAQGKDVMGAEFTGVAFYRREFLDFVGADDFSVIPIWKRAAQAGSAPGIIVPDSYASWWMDIGTHEALGKIQAAVKSGEVDLWN